jgi:hypothetical protein
MALIESRRLLSAAMCVVCGLYGNQSGRKCGPFSFWFFVPLGAVVVSVQVAKGVQCVGRLLGSCVNGNIAFCGARELRFLLVLFSEKTWWSSVAGNAGDLH